MSCYRTNHEPGKAKSSKRRKPWNDKADSASHLKGTSDIHKRRRVAPAREGLNLEWKRDELCSTGGDKDCCEKESQNANGQREVSLTG